MLILFGTKIRHRLLAPLLFFCPGCAADRAGHRGVAREWFTLFLIPVVPMGQIGEFVQCDTCHHRWDPETAEKPTTAALQELLINAVHALTLMIVRTGDGSAAVRAAALEELRATVAGYEDSRLDAEAAAVDPGLADRYVAPMAADLAVAGKERLVGDLVGVALAGGGLTPDQRLLVDRVGQALGLTPTHITGIVASRAAATDRPTPAPDDRGPRA